jgi:uncharacterized protein YjbI with pentapeptide repeats
MRIVNSTPFPFAPLAGRVHPPRPSVTLVVKGCFALEPGSPARPLDEQPPFSGDLYRDDDLARDCLYDGDLAPWKPRTDLLLVGTCHAPGGRATRRCTVSFRVGRWSKSLEVTGARTRSGFLFVRWTSRPRPFVELPLTYAHSYGGSRWAWNPVGCGHRGCDLPRIRAAAGSEPAGRRPSEARNEPAGFAPISRMWKSRTAKAGTYKGDWLEKRWPWYPDDFDWGYFNAAPADQQLEGYLAGDEELVIENLQREQAVFRARLPGLRVRAFLNQQEAEETRFGEVSMKLDTLLVDADRLVLTLIWRGVVDVRTAEMKELADVVVTAEPMAEAALPLAHYQRMLEEPAEPAAEPEPPAAAAEPAAEPDVTKEMEALNAQFAKAEAEVAELLKKQGFDLESFQAQAAKTMQKDSAGKMKEAVAKLEGLPPELRVKLPAELEAVLAEVAKLEALAAAPQAAEGEEETAGPPPWTRERCLAHAAGGGSFVGEDLSGLDLAGADLTGADLSGAILQGAKLAKVVLARANLTGAVLAEADLTGAVLTEAVLAQAEATRANLAGADLSGAKLTGALLSEAVLEGAKLAGAEASKAIFERANLKGASLAKCRLDEADLSGALLEKADLSGASLVKASLDGAKAPAADLRDADLTGLRAGEGADFHRAQLARTQAAGSIWSGAALDGADFSGAQLARADFSGASLRGADFTRADLTGAGFSQAVLAGARLRRVNLFRGSCEQADLTGADCRESNLYEVEFLEAVTKDADFRGANLKMTKLA